MSEMKNICVMSDWNLDQRMLATTAPTFLSTSITVINFSPIWFDIIDINETLAWMMENFDFVNKAFQ
jgi:hypothetical protein